MSETTNNPVLLHRQDRLVDQEGKPAPGQLYWEIGYFEKTGLDDHLSEADGDKTKLQMEKETEHEFRETRGTRAPRKIDQQKEEEIKDRTDEIISNSPPNLRWPSGILRIRIEQIIGLVVEASNKASRSEGGEDEEGDDLPSAYCVVIINHQKVFKTRTKLKENKPFVSAWGHQLELIAPSLIVFSLMLDPNDSFEI